ncbi:hypothetical protein EHM69_00325 [candidate division KSB1 bacterium]|nr:MAG: hypothetical protein EHM69_00325 [candidate division KSB1 bacterium]
MKKWIMILTLAFTALAVLAEPASPWKLDQWVIKDEVNEIADGSVDLCNVFCREESGVIFLKVTTRSPLTEQSEVRIAMSDAKGNNLDLISGPKSGSEGITRYRGVCEFSVRVPAEWSGLQRLSVKMIDAAKGSVADENSVDIRNRRSLDAETGNCAFVNHGNQGLTYTDVFRGTGGAIDKGFDEVLEIHDLRNVPGNFHMSGTLITAAEWYDPTFNQWLRDGITEGWVCMLTSAYAQHIMPFVQDNMNNWAVNVEYDMVNTQYGYAPQVAWVPERVWLANGHEPDDGIVDLWLGDNWVQHGVNAVILDDNPHCGDDNYWWDRKIHTMSNGVGITLRVIPIDGSFTGNVHYDPGAAEAQISSTTRYGLIVYGTDWEAAAEMADFSPSCPNCLENYTAVINWVGDNYPAVGAWKLDEALGNPDFNGGSLDITCGTYPLLGGTGGYGGSNNSWYNNFAVTLSHSDQHNPQWNYGNTWWQTYLKVNSAPVNNLSESGWYVMMTNLHETGWHTDGQVSDWIHRYSSHIKNAAVYAEAARWAAGLYEIPVNAYFSDIDIDGIDEIIIHNDRVFAAFESIGGRAQWVFAKGPSGYNYSVVGSCNSYWAETDGDYDESNSKNHQAVLAEVSPHYRNDLYALSIDGVTDTTAQIRLSYGGVVKTVAVGSGQPYLDVRYDAAYRDCYIQNGFSPDLVDLIWNADMARVWAPDVSYAGYRNPNTGATGVCIMGNGGASHSREDGGTLVRIEEIRGYDRFGWLLFAGETSAPDTQGRIAELEALKTMNFDHFGPRLDTLAVYINATIVEVSFTEAVEQTSAQNIAHWTMQGFSGSYSVVSAVRQSDWRRVRLVINPGLATGDNGNIVADDVTDLNGNEVLAANRTAALHVPTGVTPHTIVIDGVKDFDRPNETLFAGTDTLWLTWDSLALYVGYCPKDLATGDFFINIDTNQISGNGAARDSWDRVGFANPFRPEYQVAIEGGMDQIQLNRWNGTQWLYPGPGTPPVTSYNGWSGNLFTEVRIPWAAIGNPRGIAFNIHLTQEDSRITTRAFPTDNPTGNNITLTSVYRLYQPYISGPMPLMGVRPKYILTGDLAVPLQLVIQELSGVRRLTWQPVTNAVSYVIYRADSLLGTYAQVDETTATQYDDDDILPGTRYFYEVRAKSGI